MPTVYCTCGVRFYSSEKGTCPGCRYGEFGVKRARISGERPEGQYLPGPQEDLIRTVVHVLQRAEGRDKLVKIICFVCKSLEACHVMPPFHFRTGGSRCERGITAALVNLNSEGSVGTVRPEPGGRTSFIAKGGMLDRGDSNVDRVVEGLAGMLGGHSTPEITDLLYMHFPRMMLGIETGRTHDDISRLLPSCDRAIPWPRARAPGPEDGP